MIKLLSNFIISATGNPLLASKQKKKNNVNVCVRLFVFIFRFE